MLHKRVTVFVFRQTETRLMLYSFYFCKVLNIFSFHWQLDVRANQQGEEPS